MNASEVAVVYNPVSNKGRALNDIQCIIAEIKKIFGEEIQVLATKAPGDGISCAQTAIRNGAKLILAAGGDGTMNEVLNGIINPTTNHPEATFGIIPVGTGCDFARYFGIDSKNCLDIIRQNQTVDIDIIEAEATFDKLDGTTETKKRFCINEVSFGLSGNVVRDVNTKKRVLLSRQAFYNFHTLLNILFMKNREVVLEMQEKDSNRGRPRTINQTVTVFGNASYFGCGLKVCPHADLTSGKLAVTFVENVGRMDLLSIFSSLRKPNVASILKSNRNVTMKRSSEIWARPRNQDDKLYIEMDGELFGRLPLHAKKLHRCLRVISSPSYVEKLSSKNVPLHFVPKIEKVENNTVSQNADILLASSKNYGEIQNKTNSINSTPNQNISIVKEDNLKSNVPKSVPEKKNPIVQKENNNLITQTKRNSVEKASQNVNSSQKILKQSSKQSTQQNAPSVITASTDKVCSQCKISKSQSEYTSSQLKKKDQRKCRQCVGN